MLCTCSTGKELRGTSFKIDGRVTRRVVEPNQEKEEEVLMIHLFKGLKVIGVKGLPFQVPL